MGMYEHICHFNLFQMNQKERVISEFKMDLKKSCLNSGVNSTNTRSENGYGFKRPGLKTGVENNIFLV